SGRLSTVSPSMPSRPRPKTVSGGPIATMRPAMAASLGLVPVSSLRSLMRFPSTAAQDDERDDQAVDHDALGQADEDQGAAEQLGLLRDRADGGSDGDADGA